MWGSSCSTPVTDGEIVKVDVRGRLRHEPTAIRRLEKGARQRAHLTRIGPTRTLAHISPLPTRRPLRSCRLQPNAPSHPDKPSHGARGGIR
jgi:hypothetical protein